MINVSFWNIAFTVINLLILYVAFRIFFFKPIAAIIEQRQKEADEEYAKATTESAKASELAASYEGKLADAETEKKQIIAEARNKANAEYQTIVAQATTEAQQIHDDAVTTANNEKDKIISSAKKEIADLVVSAATKVVGTKAGADIDSDLLDKFIGKAGE